jgi:hypothetical protein
MGTRDGRGPTLVFVLEDVTGAGDELYGRLALDTAAATTACARLPALRRFHVSRQLRDALLSASLFVLGAANAASAWSQWSLAMATTAQRGVGGRGCGRGRALRECGAAALV